MYNWKVYYPVLSFSCNWGFFHLLKKFVNIKVHLRPFQSCFNYHHLLKQHEESITPWKLLTLSQFCNLSLANHCIKSISHHSNTRMQKLRGTNRSRLEKHCAQICALSRAHTFQIHPHTLLTHPKYYRSLQLLIYLLLTVYNNNSIY